MPIERQVASTHLRKLGAVPYFSQVTSEAFSDWVTVMASNADDVPHAIRAVTLLLSKRSLPADPAEVSDALNESRDAPVPRNYRSSCGRVLPGKDDQFGRPSQCIDGWIQVRTWRQVRGIVDEDGNPKYQPYDFTGRCKCQEGGWV